MSVRRRDSSKAEHQKRAEQTLPLPLRRPRPQICFRRNAQFEFQSGFLCASAGRQRRGVLSGASCFFEIELGVGGGKKFFDALAVAVADGNADAGGKLRMFEVAGHDRANAIGDARGFFVRSFRQNESEFVAAVTRGGIDGAAMNAENIGEAANRTAADKMAVAIVDFFQAVEVKKQYGKGAAGAIGALRFAFKDIEQAAVVGEAGVGLTFLPNSHGAQRVRA